MGASPFNDASTFLVRTLFDLYIFVVMLRFLLQLMRADFYNPISQFVVRATQAPLQPLRQVLPGVRGIDQRLTVADARPRGREDRARDRASTVRCRRWPRC